MYEYHATLIRIVDGDTYILDVDLGLRSHQHTTVRLQGVNTPERFTPEGKQATRAATAWLTDRPLIINTKKNPDDKYGRWAATIRDANTGDDLTAHLIQQGANRWNIPK